MLLNSNRLYFRGHSIHPTLPRYLSTSPLSVVRITCRPSSFPTKTPLRLSRLRMPRNTQMETDGGHALSSVPCVLPCGVRVIREPNPPLFGSIAAQEAFRKATMQPTRQTGFKRPFSLQILKIHGPFPDVQLAESRLDSWQPLFHQPHQT